MLLIYGNEELRVVGYTNLDFQSYFDYRKSTSMFIFTLNSATVNWKSSKQGTIVDSTTEAEYVAASEVAKEGIWLKKFLIEL